MTLIRLFPPGVCRFMPAVCFAAILLASNASAGTFYVDLNSTNSTAPYTDWSTAATNIQDAIDASVDGDLVVVTNGIYNSGGRAVYGALTNRVVINKAVTVQSVNGPAATMIYGYHSISSNAVRCVYMTNNSALIGFTLKYGATANSGGSFQEQSGGGVWCESTSATVSNCVVTGNAASFTGGGAMSGTFNNCLFTNNFTTQVSRGSYVVGGGGGAISSVLNNCLITGNSAMVGGGAAYCTLSNCVVSGNAATAPANNDYYFFTAGGGVFNGTANNCRIIKNSAYIGGGFYGFAGYGQYVDNVFYTFPNGILNNCLVASNYVAYPGGGSGGVCQGTVNNCTIVANSGGQSAGSLFSALNNCIAYYNSGSNFSGGTLNNCCTTPMPTNGISNFTNAPMFVTATEFHLLPGSPCIDAGDNSYVAGAADLDGNPRIVGGIVDAGAYEYQNLPIFIITQPSSQTNFIGRTVSFNVLATSPDPLNYLWFDGTNAIINTTNSTLTLTNIQLSDAGVYSVVLSNALNTLPSSNATLTVAYPPPTILSQPTNVTIFVGSNAAFSATVLSYSPAVYQWFLNGTPLVDDGRITGSATTNLSIANAGTNDAGSYFLGVTNDYGSALSASATLAVLPVTTADIQPDNLTTNGGASVTFNPAITGQGPFTYQWQFNGTNLADATNSILMLSNALDSQSGVYDVVVSNAAGAITSSNAALTVVPWVTPSIQPNTVVAGSGTIAVFTLTADGFSTNATYQWRLNGNFLGGLWDWTNSSSAADVNPIMSEDGFYDVIASDPYASVTSSVVTLTVIPLVITAQPTNAAAWIGGNARFSMTAVGAKPLGYQWQFNGTNIPGANTNSLTFTNVQESQFGAYNVIVTNAYTNLTSSIAGLSLSQVAVWGGNNGESNLIPGLTNIMAVTGGGFGGCEALGTNGNIIIWPNGYPSNYIQGATNFVAIAGVAPDSLSLRSDGLVDQFPGPYLVSQWSNIVAISSYYYGNHAALTANGTVVDCCVAPPADLSNVVAIALGHSHYLALKADGTVTAWGNNYYGQANVPPGLSNVIAIAAGDSHSLALRDDGTVTGWGWNSNGQTSISPNLSNVVAIAAGGFHSLALKNDGTVVAWGLNNYGQTNVPGPLTNVIAIAAGEYHSMALIGDGPPVIQAPVVNPTIGTNGFSISLPTQSGRVYVLQYNNSLGDTNWISLPLTAGNGGALTLTDPIATDSDRFYRVLQW